MEKLKQLELVEVQYQSDNKKAVLTFLDREHGEVREVNFNNQVYENGKYVDNADKKAKVDKWCKDIFNLKFTELTKAVGTKHDVYAYDTFNSLFEVDIVDKFGLDMVGQIIQTKIKEIIVDNYFIRIRFEYEGKTYESKMTFGKYMADMKQWFVDPQAKEKKFQQFKNKFGVDIKDKDSIVGKQIMVEVKKAFSDSVYCDIKPFPKSK